MNGYYKLNDILHQSLINNEDVNTILTSDTSQGQDLNKKDLYPVAFISIDTGSFTSGSIIYSVSISCMDLVDVAKEKVTDRFIGNSNAIDVYNTCAAVLRRTFNEISRGKYEIDFMVQDETAQLQKIERLENLSVGWEMTFAVEIEDKLMDICEPEIKIFDNTFDNTFN
jgi:hypothetical protein